MQDMTEYLQDSVRVRGIAARCKDAVPTVDVFSVCRKLSGWSSGILRMSIREWETVTVNGKRINDDHYQIKPGDVVHYQDKADDADYVVTVSAALIISLW